MGQVKAKKSLLLEYLLIGFVILWSGGLFSYGLFSPEWLYFLFVVSLFILFKRGIKLETKYLFVISCFIFVAFLQAIVFKGPITSVIQPSVRLLSIAMVAAIVRQNLNRVFISFTAVIASISLVCWFVDLSPDGHAFLLKLAESMPQLGAEELKESIFERYGYENYTLYFYNVSTEDTDLADTLYRNSGPFYEPGRFTIPLSIAMAMILYSGSFKKYRIPFFIIFVTNLTTMSTTGYLVMITLFAGYFLGQKDVRIGYKLLMLLLVMIIAYYVMGLSFMSDKIISALDETDKINSRFGAMYYHFPQILRSPLIGYGAFLGNEFSDLELSPCGITDMMRIWGIPLFLVCVILLYQGTRSYLSENKAYRLFFLIILLYSAYTQTIMFDPLFLLLYFIDGPQKANALNRNYNITNNIITKN